MKCCYCNSDIEGELKYVAYKAGNKPVYWKICENCMRKKWLEYKESLKIENNNASK